MAELYEPCPICNDPPRPGKSQCRACRGVGFLRIGVSREQLEQLAKCSPDKARIMRACLQRIEYAPAFFPETQALVNDARATLDAVGR